MIGRVGIVVVTHGESGRAMVDAVQRLVGLEPLEAFECVAVAPGEPRAAVTARIGEAMARIDRGSGVLILCDLYGSTPWSCCMTASASSRGAVVLSGVSLPMLVKLASVPLETTPVDLARLASQTAQKSIRTGEGS
jgi:PTS system mannose-specific IIA component